MYHKTMDIPLLDLRSITRNSDRARCSIKVRTPEDGFLIDWIVCGAVSMHREPNSSWIEARLKYGITDFEHDSAFAFKLPLIGLTYRYTQRHCNRFSAHIDPHDADGFRIPPVGYDPTKLEGTRNCLNCEGSEAHLMVDEDHWMPPSDKALFEIVRGLKVEISIGVINE